MIPDIATMIYDNISAPMIYDGTTMIVRWYYDDPRWYYDDPRCYYDIIKIISSGIIGEHRDAKSAQWKGGIIQYTMRAK